MYDFLMGMAGGNPGEQLARKLPEDNGGIGVSTVDTCDEGCETALLDKNGAHPVERYDTEKAALTGHKKWVAKAKKLDGKEVKKLGGWDGMVDDKTIKLEKG